MDITRKINESPFEYHKRLVYGKLVHKNLADMDYTELAELIYGQSYSSDVARRMMYGSRRTLELLDSNRIDNNSTENIMSELDEKMIELRKERQKFLDQRSAFNKLIRERSRQEELNEILVNAVQNGNLPRLEYSPHPAITSDNDLLVSLNDMHYGANVENAWNEYNSDICRGMMRRYLDKIITIGRLHKSENCVCWMNGDSISGNIHYSLAVTNKENVIKQVMGVSEVVSDFLAELSKHFNKVTFITVAGNHSRINPNKADSLTSERLDDLVEWYVEARLQNFGNIFVKGDKLDETIYTIDVRGKTYCGVHGDYDGSEAKIQALKTMVEKMAGKSVYAVLSGHLHHNKVDVVQGVKTIMAGSFLGMDDYCVQKRIFGEAEQMICVCDKSGVVCHYDIPLNT